MLRMSKMTDYGTVILTYLAYRPGQLHTAGEIAEQVRVALPTVSKVLKTLVHTGLVASHRGTKGGYTLARLPVRITVAEILDALEGRSGSRNVPAIRASACRKHRARCAATGSVSTWLFAGRWKKSRSRKWCNR